MTSNKIVCSVRELQIGDFVVLANGFFTQGHGVERIRHHGDGSWYRQAIKDDIELAEYRSIFKRYNYNAQAWKAPRLKGVLRLFAIFRRTDDLYEERVAALIDQIDKQ